MLMSSKINNPEMAGKRQGDRWQIAAWCSYDWASSPVPTLHGTFVFSVYFATVIMPEHGSVAWSQMTAASAFLTALLAPLLGSLADRHHRHRLLVIIMTVIAGLSLCALWWATPDAGSIWLALILSCLVVTTMELAFVGYNAMLPLLVSRHWLGRVSGFAWGAGYAGGMVSLVLVLMVLVLPETAVFGLDRSTAEPVRLVMPLAACWLLLFSLPLMFIRTPPPAAVPARQRLLPMLRALISQIRTTPALGRFLVARMLYADALVTLFAMGGIFAARVFGFSQEQVLLFAILLNITAGVGAMLGGMLDDKLGSLPTIRLALVGLAGFGLIAIFTSSPLLFWVTGAALGVFVGPLQSASRSHIGRLAPAGMEARLFGVLMLSGKLTAFIGPLCYGWLVLITGTERAGMAVVILLLLAGLWLLRPGLAARG